MHSAIARKRLGIYMYALLLLCAAAGYCLLRSEQITMLGVQSNSMYPAVKKGDLVIIRRIKASKLKSGDIISYRSSLNRQLLITHRIASINLIRDRIITKGDTTMILDEPVKESQVVGLRSGTLPLLGYFTAFMHTLRGVAVLFYLPAFVLLLYELNRYKQSQKPDYILRTVRNG